MKNLIIKVIFMLMFLVLNINASKLAECAATFYLGSELFSKIGEYKKRKGIIRLLRF